MGKRSTFERIEKDFYRTIDKRAVEALQPVLIQTDTYWGWDKEGRYRLDKVNFAEPCAGQGDLILQLADLGHTCAVWSDIEPAANWVFRKDVFDYTSQDLKDCNCVITNPPWSRHILHPLIEHLSALKPTWLLFDSDWAHTLQSAPYMRDLCTDIVSVGRLIWIPDTKMTGKDNCSWYRFDTNKNRKTIFHGRNQPN